MSWTPQTDLTPASAGALYSDFIAQVRREIEESTANVWSNTSLLTWCNEASRDIATRTLCMADEVTLNTLAGAQSYDLPDCTIAPILVTVNGRPIQRESWQAWNDRAIAQSGTPSYYCVYGEPKTLWLWPVPDAAYPVRYFRHRWPSPLTAALTDTMPFDSRHDRTIADYIKARAYEQIAAWDSADRFNKRYEDGVLDIASAVTIESDADGATSEPVDVNI